MPSYLFVCTDITDQQAYYNILNTPGVVRFITFEGKAVPIPDAQVEALQRLNSEGIDMECMEENPEPGTPVKVVSGPMKGFRGEVVCIGKNNKIILRLDTLDKCITLNIPLSMTEIM